MNFTIIPKIMKTKGSLFYIKDEYSFNFQPIQAVDLTLVFDYLSLCINSESMLAKELDGLNSYLGWINKKLIVPQAIEGGLLFNCSENILETPWKAIEIVGHDKWNTYYDKESGWVCFGDYNTDTTDEAVEFANGIIAVVSNGLIKAFWLKPVFTQPVDSLVIRTE